MDFQPAVGLAAFVVVVASTIVFARVIFEIAVVAPELLSKVAPPLVVILLVMGNAFFVGSEIALTSARRSRIKQLADTGNKAARTVQLLHKEPERFYSVTQIGITLVSLALGAIGITTMEHLIDPVFEAMAVSFAGGQSLVDVAHTAAYIFGFVVISFLHVVGGELAPKVLAFHKAETLSLAVAGIMNANHWKIPLSDPDPAVRERGLEELRVALREAKALGAPTVLLVPAVVKKLALTPSARSERTDRAPCTRPGTGESWSGCP